MSGPTTEAVAATSNTGTSSATSSKSPNNSTIAAVTQSNEDEAPPTKRPLSAYNLFFLLERKRILDGTDDHDLPVTVEEVLTVVRDHKHKPRRKHRKSHGKISFKELAQKLAGKWKEIEAHKKEVYETVAKTLWEDYEQRLAVHKAKLAAEAQQQRTIIAGATASFPAEEEGDTTSTSSEEDQEVAVANRSFMMSSKKKSNASKSNRRSAVARTPGNVSPPPPPPPQVQAVLSSGQPSQSSYLVPEDHMMGPPHMGAGAGAAGLPLLNQARRGYLSQQQSAAAPPRGSAAAAAMGSIIYDQMDMVQRLSNVVQAMVSANHPNAAGIAAAPEGGVAPYHSHRVSGGGLHTGSPSISSLPSPSAGTTGRLLQQHYKQQQQQQHTVSDSSSADGGSSASGGLVSHVPQQDRSLKRAVTEEDSEHYQHPHRRKKARRRSSQHRMMGMEAPTQGKVEDLTVSIPSLYHFDKNDPVIITQSQMQFCIRGPPGRRSQLSFAEQAHQLRMVTKSLLHAFVGQRLPRLDENESQLLTATMVFAFPPSSAAAAGGADCSELIQLALQAYQGFLYTHQGQMVSIQARKRYDAPGGVGYTRIILARDDDQC
mmetsp:Transcript_8278/g.17255  ORF Transcript_8278/g.17255 Transcript_8278/m.17255 type:complete len:599 (-) Transcript_8278:125-1921(-)